MAQPDLMGDYADLLSRFKDLVLFGCTSNLLQWDMETYMPPGAFELRGQQFALVSRLEHRASTDPAVGRLIERIENHPGYPALDEVKKRNVYLIKKNYREKTALPVDLVSEIAKQQSIAYQAWIKAKSLKDFSVFKPELEKMFGLKLRAAEMLKDVKETRTIYDALLDDFEPKVGEDVISAVFGELKGLLLPVIRRCTESPGWPDRSVLGFRVPVAAQKEISRSLAGLIGYDITSKEARGRIDEAEHPFTAGYYDDVRITTHYREDDFVSSLCSVLHEGGHAMYDQGLRREWIYTPVGAASSYGFHESQSRFVENMVGRSLEFWEYYLPELKRIVGAPAAGLTPADVFRALNAVTPSKIRVEADEATYALHVIIRFEIERDLFAGKIAVGDLPQVWNQKYADYLGVRVEDDAEGVLQDVHWSQGYFGYFPSYALGNIYSGQILHRLEGEEPGWRSLLASGDFQRIRRWLNENVHAYGNLYDPLDMLKKITGEDINPRHFVDYLNEKYARVYG